MSKNSIAVLDTNVLLLAMFAGSRRDPSKDKRLSRYNFNDIQKIENLIFDFGSLITTPNILSELSNQISGYEEYQWLKHFALKAEEHWVRSASLIDDPLLSVIGLVDLVMLRNSWEHCWIITDDSNLVNQLRANEKKVIHYQEYREGYLEEK